MHCHIKSGEQPRPAVVAWWLPECTRLSNQPNSLHPRQSLASPAGPSNSNTPLPALSFICLLRVVSAVRKHRRLLALPQSLDGVGAYCYKKRMRWSGHLSASVIASTAFG